MTEKKKAPRTAWKKGQSGNSAGKPRGTRHRATQMAQALLEKDSKAIITKIVELAKGGDLTAGRMVLDRLVPPARERALSIELVTTETAAGIDSAQQQILVAVASGEILPAEATALSGIVDARRRALETSVLEQRISELEKRNAKK